MRTYAFFSDIVSGKYLHKALGEEYIDTQKFPESKKLKYWLTFDLCRQTRILKGDFTVDDEGIAYIDATKTTVVSDRLASYVKRAWRQLSYGVNSGT